ncbi:hypothetical protein HZB60_00395 [candidate division KSB1 bacterium]|nr:hypothetical protein [candidate division KSB1 bacterium]
MKIILSVLLFGMACAMAAPVHTTYLWHLEQPVYWPAPSQLYAGYETAWESIQHRNAGASHPQNDLTEIFSVADRVAAYQSRPAASIATMSGVDAGAQVTYSGGLIRNVASLGSANQLGYSPGWSSSFDQARDWQTSGGRSRLELTVIPYHHALAPLVDREVLKKEIQIYQYLYPFVWGSTPAPSTGFFPPELAFSERIIPVLAECGLSWCFVPSNHLSRACSNFPMVYGTGGENCNPPNPADQVNPASSNWFSLTISRGCTPTDAVPFGFQPHRAQHINPATGVAAQVIVVPVAMAMSWMDGYQSYGVGDINAIASQNDPAHPMLVTLGHDGDNAFGGGYSYYMESVPSLTSQAVSAGYEPTTVPEFLADHPLAGSDLVHVEDGAWINADGDFGDPDFINWNWPPYNSSGQFDIAGGWALDIRNWAIITAATNRVVTAEALAGGVTLGAVQDPSVNPADDAELAWHFLLGSLNSGFMYYGNALDMEVKATVACNAAVSHADAVLAQGGDPIPPTIWALQQLPHNPGGVGFGPLYGYQQRPQARDFWVWTFIHDVSGVETVTLNYRLDLNGDNPLASAQNETFAGGGEVTSWRSRAMTRRVFPAGNVYNEAGVYFDVLPTYIAEEYYYHLTDGEVTDSGDVLVDYYVEALDSLGNIARSDIYHTYVGTGSGGSTPGDRVSWSPQSPVGGDPVTILYDLAASPLPPATDPVYIHVGHSGWQQVVTPDPAMSYDSSLARWTYTYVIPLSATSVDFVFRTAAPLWDNNGGQDWRISVTAGSSGFALDGALDSSAVQVATNGAVTLWADFDGNDLYLATERALGTGSDRFLLFAQTPGSLRAAPWAKAGQVADWAAYLAEESSNGWRGWFDATGSVGSAAGAVLECTINVSSELGALPPRIHVAAVSYNSPDGGALTGQAPAAVLPNGNVESGEWAVINLLPDSLTISALGGAITLRWSPAFGAGDYSIYRSTDLTSTPVQIGSSAATEFTEPTPAPMGFYTVRARY